MKFYFYSNKSVLFDYLERNIIAPDSVVHDKLGNRTISVTSENFLFVTHKKLSRKVREQGITTPESVYPITLELREPNEDDHEAIFLMKKDGSLEYQLKKLNEYNPDTCIGAYLLGEIPLSCVEKIYFDTHDDVTNFKRPSPDYWYPTNKYGILPEDFSEEFTLTPDEEKIISAGKMNVKDIIRGIEVREKERAGLLNFVVGTRNWQYGNYRFSIDRSLMRFLGLHEDDVSTALPHYLNLAQKEKDNVEQLDLFYQPENQMTDLNQKIYNIIYRTFLDVETDLRKSPNTMIEVVDSLSGPLSVLSENPNEKNQIKCSITEIEELISGKSDKTPEEILAAIPKRICSLSSLLFVAKNPKRYDDFLRSLEVYNADQLTKRRAMVLWGVLNGLLGFPGNKFHKDNQLLWQYIEAYVEKKNPASGVTLSTTFPQPCGVENGAILGIELHEERVITASDVREALLKIPLAKLKDEVFEKLFELAVEDCGSKKKAENKGYAYRIASVTLPAIKKGEELSIEKRKKLEQLLKDAKNLVPNKEKLHKDYLEKEDKFKQVFAEDPKSWKEVFNNLEE
ncbi:MAG: hypothetical protein LKE33_00330 [Acidaminococcus sp.]|jgi:hypothetical protein|nr:hypothetical protein [Acidaminococcus sp.]MCI2101097.1 hypothetical protein [Acidaminococcus sp.]MCI2117631.1 hypothetical protein [Acidaminococcus sp.]